MAGDISGGAHGDGGVDKSGSRLAHQLLRNEVSPLGLLSPPEQNHWPLLSVVDRHPISSPYSTWMVGHGFLVPVSAGTADLPMDRASCIGHLCQVHSRETKHCVKRLNE